MEASKIIQMPMPSRWQICRNALQLALILVFLSSCRRPTIPDPTPIRPLDTKNLYTFGEVIQFGDGGRSQSFTGRGWGVTENDFTWTNGKTAELVFSTPSTNHPLKLIMRLRGFTYAWAGIPYEALSPPILAFQDVEVLVNNQRVADWQVGPTDDYTAVIPPDIANHLELRIELRIPHAASPNALKLGRDTRMLGLCCYRMEIDEIK